MRQAPRNQDSVLFRHDRAPIRADTKRQLQQARCGSEWVSGVRVLSSLPVSLFRQIRPDPESETRLVEHVCFSLGVDWRH